MTINQSALIQTIYDSIFSTFIQGATPPPARNQEMFLTLEWPGQQLDASQYQNPWSPHNPNGSQFATEMFSALVDAIPLVDAMHVDSGVTVEEMYEFALAASAIPLSPSADGTSPPNPVDTVIANARQLFEQTKQASALHPALTYRSSYATPANWYDDVASRDWTQININSNQTQTIANSPFTRTGGINRVKAGIWKLPQATLAPGPTRMEMIKATRIRPTSPIMINPHLNPTLARSTIVATTPVLRANVAPLTAARTQSLITDATTVETLEMQRISPNPVLLERIRPATLDQAKLVALKDQTLDQETKDIQISFRCCRVNFNRPWMMKSMLGMSGWTLAGQSAGCLSSGTLENNTGLFPLLPTGFIAIRDLQIRANWGRQDREIATKAGASGESVGFGPFALSGTYAESGKSYTSSFDGVTIASPGLQILGWINLVLPFMPPA